MANPYVQAGRKYWKRKSRREEEWTWGGSTESKDDITPEEDEARIKQDQEIVQAAIERERQERESQDEEQRLEAETRAEDRSLFQRALDTATDIFSADTEADKQRRREAGQPESYEEQQRQKKETAEQFTEQTREPFEKAKRFEFTKEDIEARRNHYQQRGIDIDQLIQDKKEYDKVIEKIGGAPEENAGKLARLKLKGEISESALRFQDRLEAAEKAEQTYQRGQRIEAGAESTIEQVERGFVRGFADPIVSIPSNVQTLTGAAGKAIAPEGSTLQRKSEELYQSGTESTDELARRVAASGYEMSAADNPLATGIGQGVGSLTSSLGLAAATGGAAVPALVFGGQAAAEQTRGATEAGKSDVQSFLTGSIAGAAEGVLEKFGLDRFVGAKGGVVKQFAKRVATEGTQEATQSLAQSGAEATYTDVDLSEAIQEAVQEGGLGALVGGGASLPMSISQKLQDKGVPDDAALKAGMDVQDKIESIYQEVTKQDQPAKGPKTPDKESQPTKPQPVVTVKESGTENIPETTGERTVFATVSPVKSQEVAGKPITVAAKSSTVRKQQLALSETAKVLSVENMPESLYKTATSGKTIPAKGMKAITDHARSQGFDAVDLTGFGRDEMKIINPEVLSKPGKTPKIAAQAQKDQPTVRRDTLDALAAYDAAEDTGTGRESARSAEDLTQLADQLNKAAQAGAILRRGDYRSKKNLGAFERKKSKGKSEEVVKLQDKVIKDPRMYATVLAHEVSHAIEYKVVGDTKNTYKLFGELSAEEQSQIENELKTVVNEIEGQDIAEAKPDYYYKPTEMVARFVETMVLHPGKVDSIAPKTLEKFEQLVAEEPMVADLWAALDKSLDKGFKNITPDIVKDLRQIYRKRLGKRVGDLAYNAEVNRRAEQQRAVKLIDQLIKRKFKNVKDAPDQLFKAAEAIKVTEDGEPTFGTHDFLDAFTEKERKDLEKAGWKQVGSTQHDGKEGHVYSRVRYTPEQAEAEFNKLSPEGQQLIKDFTAAKEEARDDFNRELLKQVYGIETKLEGWVHHYFDGQPLAGNKSVGLRAKVAAAKKQRKGSEGYVEDFRKATTKAMLELERNEINNNFIREQLARISKPIAKGQTPDKGWVEIVADEKGGLRLPGEGLQVIIKPDAGGAIKLPQRRYQVPTVLAEHYREIRDLPEEANKVAKFLNRAAKYWTINVLIHPGSTATNFFGGGLQYTAKIMNDFYMDLFTANFSMSRTRADLVAPLSVLTPKGWNKVPDWMFGGYRANLAGQVATGNAETDVTKLDKGLDAYGNKMLKLFGLVDTYWKKVIAASEGGKMSASEARSYHKRLSKEEKDLVAKINETVDFYGFDYDNKPLWLQKFDRHGGSIVKPFMTYPYKLTKFYTAHAAAAFDRTKPWQERTAKLLTITTIVAAIAMAYDDLEEKMETPEGTEDTPHFLRPGGRVLTGISKTGEELFVRTGKYPWFNLTSFGKAAIEGNGQQVSDLLVESFGTVGPGFELFLMATGRGDQFDQYTPQSVRTAELTGSFIPVFRIFDDIGTMIDETKRKPETFAQGIGGQLPIWGSEETRAKWRGDPRTVKIPDEPEEGRPITKTARTVTKREDTKPASDTLMSLLTGIYVRRIDPKEARNQELREQRDAAEDEIRRLLAEGNEADANALGEEHGLWITDDTRDYYRRKR